LSIEKIDFFGPSDIAMCKHIGTLHRFLPKHDCGLAGKTAAGECEVANCHYRALYGAGETVAHRRRCSRHALQDDRRIYNVPPQHVCARAGCTLIAYYGPGRRVLCGRHRHAADTYALSRACQHAGCPAVAQWSATGLQLVRCTRHRRAGDMRQKRRTCVHNGCRVAMKVDQTRCAAHC